MGHFSERMNHIVRGELNSASPAGEEKSLSEGSAAVLGGAMAGAAVGKVGILAGGAGYSLGAIPLMAAGVLTGAALYETLRAFIEGDSSSINAAAIGAMAGAATSASVGGVGVAIGGSAIGVGMASMAAGGAVVGLGLVGLNRLFHQGVDPEMLLDVAIEQMDADLQETRQAIAKALVNQEHLQNQCEQSQQEVNQWQQRAQQALQRGDDNLARQALLRKKTHTETLLNLTKQINQGADSLKNIQDNLTILEKQLCEAKNFKMRLQAQISAIKVSEQLQQTADSIKANMMVFERMEEKVQQMEALSSSEKLQNSDLEHQLAMLESDSFNEVLEELKQMQHRPSKSID